MGMNDLTPDFEGDIKRAQANFRKITELKEKLEILTEHVQSRKEALDEEIEESLHDSIRNARDCLEKIQENVSPKLDKFIQAKLGEIDKQLGRWKDETLESVRGEIEKNSPALSERLLKDVEAVLSGKINVLKRDLIETAEKEAESKIQTSLEKFNDAAREEFRKNRFLSFMALGLSIMALFTAAWALL